MKRYEVTSLFALNALTRSLKRASVRDVLIGAVRALAGLYQVGFALYLPASRYTSFPAPAKYRWFAGLAAAVLLDRGLAYIPKRSAKLWQLVELERLRATGVAVSRLDECTRRQTLTATDFREVAQGLLTAIRSDVQAFTVEETGYYINTSLLVEDVEDSSKLKVVARAIPNRVNRSYSKSSLLAWQAMEKQRLVFERKFSQIGKPYCSILVIPLLLDTAASTRSIGAISIDSGRSGEFDEDIAKSLEERLYPYTALLGLLLSLQTAFQKEDDNGTSA